MKEIPQVITVTPAPCIDRTYQVNELARGGTHRAHHVSAEFAGKGVNVTQALTLGGIASRAIVPLTNADEDRWADTESLIVSPASQDIRINITITEPDGTTTKVNEQPSPLTRAEWSALAHMALENIQESSASWLVVAGTLPGDTDEAIEAVESLITQATAAGCKVALDTSGPALMRLARAGLPDFIKPNAAELAECVGRPIATIGDVIDAGTEIAGWGVESVVVSLGPDGIVGINADRAVHAWTLPLDVRNTIGAGDASVAGFLAHVANTPGDLEGAVAQAVTWGAQKVQQEGSQLQHFDDPVEVTSTLTPHRDRRLTEPGVF